MRRIHATYDEWTARALTLERPPGDMSVIRAMMLFQDGRCYLCVEPFREGDQRYRVSRDHVTPRIKGGVTRGNILLAHACCNERKTDRDPTPEEKALLRAFNDWAGVTPPTPAIYEASITYDKRRRAKESDPYRKPGLELSDYRDDHQK